jgi:hypothetical protein
MIEAAQPAHDLQPKPPEPTVRGWTALPETEAGGTNSYGNARVISQFYNNFLRSKGRKVSTSSWLGCQSAI